MRKGPLSYIHSLFIKLLILLIFPLSGISQIDYALKTKNLLKEGLYLADEKKDYESAIPFFLNAIEVEKKREGTDSLVNDIFNLLYHSYGYNREYGKAMEYAKQSFNYLQKKYGIKYKKTIDTYYDIGYLFDNLKMYDSARLYYFNSIENYKAFSGESTADLALTYHNLGDVMIGDGEFGKSIEILHKALNIWLEIAGDSNSYTIATYNALGIAYRKIGERIKGLQYLEKSLALSEQTGISTYGRYAEVATIYSDFEYKLEKSIVYYKKALERLEVEGGDLHDKATIYSLIGERYRSIGQYKEALKNLNKARSILEEITYPRPYSFIDIWIKTGRIYRHLGDHSKARYYMIKGLKGAAKLKSTLYTLFACDQLSLSFQQRGNFDSAFIYRQYGMGVLENNDFSLTDTKYAKEIDIKPILPVANYFIYLINRSDLFLEYYKAGLGEEVHLDLAEQGLEAANDLAKLIEARGSSGVSMKAYVSDMAETYIELMLIRYKNASDISYLEKAFWIIERNKAQTLLSNLQNNQARKFAGIPDSVLSREQKLKTQITGLNQRIYLERRKGAKSDTSLIRSWQNELFSLNREFEVFTELLDEQYSDYHGLKYQKEVASSNNIQQNLLDKETAIIEYFWSDSSLFVFTIQQNDLSLEEINVHKDLKQKIVDFREIVSNPSTEGNNEVNHFQELGFTLYQTLLSPSIEKLSTNISRLIIVPDRELNYIPFEVLLNEPSSLPISNYQELSYLIKKFDIDYAYSATVLLKQIMDGKKSVPNLLAAFAPDYEDYEINEFDTLESEQMAVLVRNGNLPLPGARSEAEMISNLFGGNIFVENQATEEAFKQNAGNYQILHLAMHTLMEEDEPLYSKLLFSQSKDSLEDNFLYVDELYNLQLNSDLVVLSACNTGYGRFSQNEGLMSISRAFAYAGCPSVVMSLWKIPDKETSQIMVDFYQNLKKGDYKDHSLRQAKLTYLDQVKVPELAHPFYWAGFISMGNNEPLDLGGWNLQGLIVIGLLVLAVIIGVAFWRNKKLN